MPTLAIFQLIVAFQLPFWYLEAFNPGVNRVYYKEDSNITLLEFKITSYNYKYKITSDMMSRQTLSLVS